LFAGVLSVVLSVLTVWWVFTEPAFTFAPLDRVHLRISFCLHCQGCWWP